MTEQRVSPEDLNAFCQSQSWSGYEDILNVSLDLRDARAEIAKLKQSLFQAEQKELSQDMEIAALQSRIREADRIIDQAYRHCVMARETGALAYAITTPLIAILTQPFKESLTTEEAHDVL